MIRTFASLAAALAIPFAISSCGTSVVTGTCTLGDTIILPGQTVPAPDGCNTCTCGDDGEALCTLLDCAQTCEYLGDLFEIGDTFPAGDECNSCTCEGGGIVTCTALECGALCEWQGQLYYPGDSFPAGDGCNSCTCEANGEVSCTAAWCGECVYNGVAYVIGEVFPAGDGCNSCTCAAGGLVSCTEMVCACDPKAEWWRKYVSQDPAQCAVIDFACPPNTLYFENTCGCGCQQDASCPQYFDCMPPAMCDVQALMAKCPYSGFVF